MVFSPSASSVRHGTGGPPPAWPSYMAAKSAWPLATVRGQSSLRSRKACSLPLTWLGLGFGLGFGLGLGLGLGFGFGFGSGFGFGLG